MVSMLASKAVHCRLEPMSDQAKDYKIGNCQQFHQYQQKDKSPLT